MRISGIFKFVFALIIFGCVLGLSNGKVHALGALMSPYSWDPGLYATTSPFNHNTHAWGMRKTSGAWGTGPVNYQSGSTTNYRANFSGELSVDLNGTYCPNGQCSYGSGTGYKGLVQFWNDPSDYIAFGIIHDPGVSPSGTTFMIEGAAYGQPIGGYWPNDALPGTSHNFDISWTGDSITITIDNNVTLGSYYIDTMNPSISFLAAARDTGDIADTTFNDISFSGGSISSEPVEIPSGNPYLSYTATLNMNGSGQGNSMTMGVLDNNNNNIVAGIFDSADQSQPYNFFGALNDQPYVYLGVTQNGSLTYISLPETAYTGTDTTLTLEWWQGQNIAVLYINNTPIEEVTAYLNPRLYFTVDGEGNVDGDVVNDSFSNLAINVGNICPSYCGTNGLWSSSNNNGISVTEINPSDFSISGTTTGLTLNSTWQSSPAYATIAQYWNGQ